MGVYEKAYFEKYEQMINEIEDSSRKDSFTFLDVYMTTLVNTFKWTKLVDKMPSFMMERFLQTSGRVAIFEDKGEFKILPCFPSGGLTEYGEYDEYYMVSRNGTNYYKKADEIEICYNNSYALPYFHMAKHFSEKTKSAMDAIDGALERAGLGPILVATDDTQRKQLVDVAAQANTRKLYSIIPNGTFDPNKAVRLPIFDNKETDVIALWDVYTRYRNLYYSTIGINNIEIQKRERLTQAEGSGNDEIVRYSLLDDMYQQRTDWVARTFKHFGINLEFEVQRDAATVYNLKMSNAEKIEYMKVEMTKGSNIAGNASMNNDDGGNEDEKE